MINDSLVRKLVAQQFPHLCDLSVRPIRKQGWDNRTFRLGDELSVRLPSKPSYAAAVQKEAIALSALSSSLSVAIPEVIALGEPSEDYPLPWSIRRWIVGKTLEDTQILDRRSLAKAVGTILVELRSAHVSIDLLAGKHSFYRGCHPSVYGDEVVKSLNILNGQIDTKRCLDIWQNGMTSAWTAEPIWFHGDIAVGNVLMAGKSVKALIDFGTCGVGDPACDFAIAWTYFDANERQHFRDAIKVDDDTWHRAKAWALWKALVSLTELSSPDTSGIHARALNEVLIEGLN